MLVEIEYQKKTAYVYKSSLNTLLIAALKWTFSLLQKNTYIKKSEKGHAVKLWTSLVFITY